MRVFSGRQDPTWEPSAEAVAALQAIWEQLEAAPGVSLVPPRLGYRGCVLLDPAGKEWDAYAGIVMLRDDRGSVVRRDPDRWFESALLGSAPPGRLPADLGPGAPLGRVT
ncbi:MAG TPA: hypothetical protein VNA31_09745 [bacterium]|nr:hypothetical protein [bacterium]